YGGSVAKEAVDTQSTMEVELDVVEEDVERKRVGKNPFDQRFTALTESPFTETSTSTAGNGGHDIETISRHIIVRMEVIAKQIAFLSKETAGQPDKVLAGGGRVGASSSSASPVSRQQRNVSAQGAEDGPLATSADIGGRSGVNGGGGGNDDGTDGRSGDSSSPFGAPLVARLDLYHRIRQGQATAEDLIPAGMLAAPLGKASFRPKLVPKALTPPTIDNLASPTDASTVIRHEEDGNQCGRITSDGEGCSGGVSPPAPGILHGFIKHVKPFSVCYASAAQADRPPKEKVDDIPTDADNMSTSAADEGHGGGNSDNGGGGDEDDNGSENAPNVCDYGDHVPCSPYEAAIDHATPTSSAGRSPAKTIAAAGAAATAGGGLTHTRAEEDGDASSISRSSKQGGEQERQHGAPRKPALPPAGGSEALRRAKARLQGKRKLSYPGFSSPIAESPATRPGYYEPEDGEDGDSAEGGKHGDEGAMSAAGGGLGGGGGGGRGRGGGSSALHRPLRGIDASRPTVAATVTAAARVRNLTGADGTRGVEASSQRKDYGNNGNSNNQGKEGATGKKRRGAVAGGAHGGGNCGGGGVDPSWLALSWSSAKQLRKQMEAAATAAVKLASEEKGGRRSKGRGGGGGGAASSKKKITLSDPVAASGGGGAVSSIAPLGLVPCSNTLRMEFPPAADELGLECYLASLANPVRDLAAMKRAFEEEPQLSPADVSGGMTPSPEASPSLSALGATPPSDGFDFDLGPDFQNETAVATAVVAADDNIGEVGANVEADLPGGSAHPGSKTPKPNTAEPRGGALRTATARQPPPQLPAPPVRTSDAAATAKGLNPGGTCMIDLRNIWQRTGAVSRAISQTSVKQSSLVKDLRESLVRLDLQHRQKEEQEARRQIAEPVDGGKHRADGG
ncbi:unnamed protein product, partial [Ectocarpus fasciculatus]